MFNFFKQLLRQGFIEQNSLKKNARIQFINFISLFLFLLGILLFVLYTINQSFLFGLVNFIFGSIILFTIYLNKKDYTNFSRFYIIFCMNFFLLFFGLVQGSEFGFQYSYFFTIIFIFLLYNKDEFFQIRNKFFILTNIFLSTIFLFFIEFYKPRLYMQSMYSNIEIQSLRFVLFLLIYLSIFSLLAAFLYYFDRVEKENFVANQKLKLTLNSIGDMILILDKNLFVQEYYIPNNEYFHEFNQIVENLKLTSIALPFKIFNKINIAIEFAKEKRVPQTIDYSLVRNKKTFFFSGNLTPRFISEKFDGCTVVIRNITSQMEIYSKLQESEKKLSLIFNYSNAGIVLCDMDGKIISHNPQFCKMLGYEESELQNKNFLEFTYPDDISKELILIEKIISQKQNAYTIEKRFLKKNMDTIWARINVSLTFYDDQVHYLIAIIDNITDIKNAQLELEESEQKFREIAENVEHVLWLSNQERVMYISPSFETIYGQSREMAYQNKMYMIGSVLPEDKQRVILADRKVYEEGISFNEEFRVQLQDNQIRWIWARSFIIQSDKEIRTVGIAQDITERKLYEQKMQDSLEREKELNRMKSNFVSMVSHQFRTPLTTIKSSIQLLEMYQMNIDTKLSQTFEKHFKRITLEINRINELIEDSMTLGKIETGKYPFKPQSNNILELCQSILNQRFHLTYKNRNTELTYSGVLKNYLVDENLFVHIVSNILSNAYKYSNGNPKLKIDFWDNEFIIQIIDKGIGIPNEEQKNLFRSFFRATNTANIPGTGLGLVIVKEFLDLHNGKIVIESEMNQGTIVTITIPDNKE